MILTVTLNAALDVTYDVDELRPDASHRVRAVHQRAGGKGINVARVLRARGRAVTALGLLGGPTGARIRDDLEDAGIPAAMTTIAGESRRTVSVVSASTGGSTLFNEPGPEVAEDEWLALVAEMTRHLDDASVVVMSGSLPPGAPQDAYAQLVRVAHGSGVRAIVDADGTALSRSIQASPDVVKPNAAELHAATGLDDPGRAMRWLLEAGVGAVVATFGPDGIRALAHEGAWVARLGRGIVATNPTGAGDAVAAALAAGLEDGRDWPSMLADAVAWSVAAVTTPLAGDLDASALDELRATVRVVAVTSQPPA